MIYGPAGNATDGTDGNSKFAAVFAFGRSGETILLLFQLHSIVDLSLHYEQVR
jgi:hypothetical protein